jgi:hypothetical protein
VCCRCGREIPEGRREAWPTAAGVVCYGCHQEQWSPAREKAEQFLKSLDLAPAEHHKAKSLGEHLLLKAFWEWQDASNSIRRHLDPLTVSAALLWASGIAEQLCGKPKVHIPPRPQGGGRT